MSLNDGVPDVLSGLTIRPSDLRAQLQPMASMKAHYYGTCRKCAMVIVPGSPMVQCLRYGWMHKTCLAEAQAELEARSDGTSA
jgi:hypothetical protein